MSWSVSLTTKYHQQDVFGCYCGAAAAMMILQYLDPDAPMVQQDVLYPWMHNRSPQPWAIAPSALAEGLIHFAPTFAPGFEDQLATTLSAFTDLVVQALCAEGAVPPSILLDGCAHWGVVTGLVTDVEPKPGTAYVVKNFWMNIPTVVPTGGPCPPHTSADVCGSGVVNGYAFGAPALVTYAGWQNIVLKCILLEKKYAGVFAGSLASIGTRREPTPAARRTTGGAGVLSKDQAAVAALAEAAEYGIGKGPLTAGEPALVQRIDLLDDYYYLVPLSEANEPVATAQLDATTGQLLAAQIGGTLLPIDSPRTVLGKIDGQAGDPCDATGTAQYHQDTVSVAPILAWRPCRQSLSPFAPFHQIVVRGTVKFRDQAGQIHATLTDPCPGS